jgi:hypothetical protein
MWLLVVATILACVAGAALGAWIAVTVFEAEPPAPARDPAPAPRPARKSPVASVPAPLSGGAHTGLIERRCAAHPEAVAEWTCRFCKREHCARCRVVVGEYTVCPSAACQESARNFGGRA